jgi:hypothetical protein
LATTLHAAPTKPPPSAPPGPLPSPQVMLMLLIAFTTLPLMTGRLVDALNTATKFQRGSFKRGGGRGQPGHFVFLGYLDADTITRLMDEVGEKGGRGGVDWIDLGQD